jgi:hypothetical protein
MFHTPVLAFFSKAFYQDAAWRWRGTNLLYLFLLLAVAWLPQVVKVSWGLSRFLKQEAPAFVEQVPPVHIRDGKLSVEAPEPYIIRVEGHDKPLMLIDTTGEFLSLDDTDAYVLATETKVYTRNSPTETRTYDLSQVKRFDLDKARVAGWIDVLRRWFGVVMYPTVLLGSYVYRVVQALVYGLIGLGFASAVRARLTYQDAMRLSVVAVTPVIVLDTALGLAGVGIASGFLWWLVCLAIAMAYLFLGVKWAAERPPEADEDGDVLDAVAVDDAPGAGPSIL